MAKLQSTFKNMLLSLTGITLVAAAALAGIFMLTKTQIEEQQKNAQNAAKIAVLNGQDGVAIETEADGFGGKIKLMVGFASDGTILGYEVLEQQETPGLGSHIEEWFKNAEKPGQNIIGRKANGQFTVSKDGGEVDAITAATISSRAFLNAINTAYTEFMQQQGIAVEACTGATIQQTGCEHQCCGKCQGEEHQRRGKCQGEEHQRRGKFTKKKNVRKEENNE